MQDDEKKKTITDSATFMKSVSNLIENANTIITHFTDLHEETAIHLDDETYAILNEWKFQYLQALAIAEKSSSNKITIH